MAEDTHLIVWDGDCGFCRRAVAWALARDAAGRLSAVTFQEAPATVLTPELRRACGRAVYVRTADGRWLRAGRACMFVLERVGWPRLGRLARRAPFVWAVELGYWLVARNRRIVSRSLDRRAA